MASDKETENYFITGFVFWVLSFICNIILTIACCSNSLFDYDESNNTYIIVGFFILFGVISIIFSALSVENKDVSYDFSEHKFNTDNDSEQDIYVMAIHLIWTIVVLSVLGPFIRLLSTEDE